MPSKKESFSKLYDENIDRVRGIIFRLAHSDDLEELCQETFLKVWKNYGFFEQRSKSSTWIYKIALHTAYDSLRRKKIERSAQPDFSVASEQALEEKLSNQQLLQEGLRQLELSQRTILILREWEGFSEKECAKILSIAEGTVKSRLSRSKKELRKFLESKGVKI